MMVGGGPSTYGPTLGDFYGSGGFITRGYGPLPPARDAMASSPSAGTMSSSMAPTAWLIGIIAFLVLWRMAYYMGANVGD